MKNLIRKTTLNKIKNHKFGVFKMSCRHSQIISDDSFCKSFARLCDVNYNVLICMYGMYLYPITYILY